MPITSLHHALAWVTLAAGCAGAASAQTVAPGRAPAAASSLLQDSAAARVTLGEIVWTGAALFTPAQQTALAQPFLDQALWPWQIEAWRMDLTRQLVAQGWINSGVRLAADALTPLPDGRWRLHLTVVAGVVQDLQINGLDDLDPGYVRQRLWPDPQAPLQLAQLRQRYQRLLEDPLLRQVNLQVQPGDAPGTAVLAVQVQRAPTLQWRLSAGNDTPPSIGGHALGVQATWRNLGGWGDALQWSVQAPPDRPEDARHSLSWRWPFKDSGVWLDAQTERGRAAVVEGDAQQLDIRSQLVRHELGLGQQLRDDGRSQWTQGLSVSWRQHQTTLAGEPFSFVPEEALGRTKVQTLRAWQELSVRDPQAVHSVRATLSWSHRVAFGLDAAPGAAPIETGFLNVLAQTARRLNDDGLQWQARALLQWSPTPLMALDRLALGGVQTVRGFRENQLVRDRGLVLSTSLDWAQPTQLPGQPVLHWIPFVDWGQGQNVGQPVQDLAATGVTWRWQWQRTRLELSKAWRLSPPIPRPSPARLQDRGWHVQWVMTL